MKKLAGVLAVLALSACNNAANCYDNNGRPLPSNFCSLQQSSAYNSYDRNYNRGYDPVIVPQQRTVVIDRRTTVVRPPVTYTSKPSYYAPKSSTYSAPKPSYSPPKSSYSAPVGFKPAKFSSSRTK